MGDAWLIQFPEFQKLTAQNLWLNTLDSLQLLLPCVRSGQQKVLNFPPLGLEEQQKQRDTKYPYFRDNLAV